MSDHEVVYSYIREVAKRGGDRETSESVYKLLVDLSAPRQKGVQEALRGIVNHPDFCKEPGLQFINRCIYTAINPLHLDVARHDDLKRLVERLAQAPSNAQNPDTRKLRRALHRYIDHDMYKSVRRQARLVDKSDQGAEDALSDLFPHYSFLYINGAVTSDIRGIDEGKKPGGPSHLRLTEGIHRRREEQIFKIRRELSVYWERRRHRSAQPITNPTRLTNEELDLGIMTYHTSRPNSFKDRAVAFSRQTRPEANMSQYRDDVLHYITQPLESLAPQHQSRLTERFTHSLKTMEADSGVMKATVIQAFKKILDDMMFYKDKPSARDFHALKRYVREISPCKYVAILLNLVLGCPMIIYKLEERLTNLYIYHEHMALESLSWLVKFFEYMHLALVMNFRYYDTKGRDNIPKSILWSS